MNARKWKSRRRGHYRGTKNIQGKITTVLIVIAVSIFAGYFTATYVIGPLMGLETKSTLLNFTQNEEKKEETKPTESTTENEENIVENRDEGESLQGYALQYGSFSTKVAAEASAAELERSGIETEIIEKDGAYKVIGTLFDTKAEAKAELEKQEGVIDVFITQFP